MKYVRFAMFFVLLLTANFAGAALLYQSQLWGEFTGFNYANLYPLTIGDYWEQTSFHYAYRYAYSPTVYIYYSGGQFTLSVQGSDTQVTVVPALHVNESRFCSGSGYQGYAYGNVYCLVNGSTWRQTSSAYQYDSSFNPTVYIWPASDGYRMQVEGMDSSVRVEFAGGNRFPSITSVSIVPTNPMVGQTVTFTVNATDPDGGPMTYRYYCNTANPLTNRVSSTVYSSPGLQSVWFYVFDNYYACDYYKTFINVLPAAQPCSYAILPASTALANAGGSGTISVTAGSGCGWTATESLSWVSITAGASGSGNGTVSYSVTANTGNARTGTLTVAGQTFTIVQAGQSAPPVGDTPASVIFPVSFAGRWIHLYLWENTAGQWRNMGDWAKQFAPTQVCISNIVQNQYYWLGIFDYTSGAWSHCEWIARFDTGSNGRYVGHIQSSPSSQLVGFPKDTILLPGTTGHRIRPTLVNLATGAWNYDLPEFTSAGYYQLQTTSWDPWLWLVFYDNTTGRWF